jgi:CBS domain-containing protein/anti-sigma regulatory factor (Ser/Thr protein kinase)
MEASEAAASLSKTQELVYELAVERVMTREVLSIAPETPMSELRAILRDNRISGTPVLRGTELVGVISVEDFINWLAQGGPDCPVADRMSRRVRTLFADEPVAHAIRDLEEFGIGRLPVLDRESRRLVGVVTKGDIIEGLLKALDLDFRREELRRYRASHLFTDMIADHVAVEFEYGIRGRSIEHGGTVASALKRSLRRLGIHPDMVRRAGIATYEAEMNVIIYARSGRVRVVASADAVRIEVQDEGDGIADIEQAMRPGFSTAPDWVRALGFGAGMGLYNIKRCVQAMKVTSTAGEGTRLELTVARESECA